MAWDKSEFCGESVIVGDKPMDELGLALTRISTAYFYRYYRKPTVAEVLAAFNSAMLSNANAYFSDPETLSKINISLKSVDYEN